jgi:LmbE family N-acetylglucosaminyl deacetylase
MLELMTDMQCDYHEPFTPKRILAIGAHADDIDVGAGASIAGWAADGTAVAYLVVTDGSKGSEDATITHDQLVALRQSEQRAAAQILGVQDVNFLAYEDGALAVTTELKKDIVRFIRSFKPDTVITLDPTMVYSAENGILNHPDHRAVGQATLDAIYPLARDHLAFPELFDQAKLQPHKVEHVLLMNFDTQNCTVNVTDMFHKKMEALAAHKSQFGDATILDQHLRAMATKVGEKAGYGLAEGFMRVDVR